MLENILNELNLGKELKALYKGEIPIIDEYSMFRFYIEEPKTGSFAHPPFFIPFMYSYDADHYHVGIIKHWFSDRKISFGDMIDGSGFQTNEIARNEKQLFSRLLFNEFVNSEDCIVTERLEKCAALMGLRNQNFLEFQQANQSHQQNPECNLSIIDTNRPLSCLKENEIYDGEFPSNDKLIILSNVPKSCYFEIFQKEWIGYNKDKSGFPFFKKHPKYKPIDDIPEWLLANTNKKELFEKYIISREYDKAWFTINGIGFTPKEVGERLYRLKEFTNEKAYHLWADFWCEKYGDMDSFIFI
ncbi:hypothetical protein DBR39_12515 [Chryseobacterium sp. KBW03]|uniref:hypothetical protein n=1 Tax=Chryseobacterium sp. KBW03 TaxID=2153362 RepID=UPI000F5A950A|nr:hypothetical protein [Chryseobacterium sp. KBW03]RQO37706.1 hypothetical protein DBR39_12515 [Chryseobacterium sp. KBW03]